MKTTDDYYKEWSGESHLVNSNIKVHDSAEMTDFAEYFCQSQTKILKIKNTIMTVALIIIFLVTFISLSVSIFAIVK